MHIFGHSRARLILNQTHRSKLKSKTRKDPLSDPFSPPLIDSPQSLQTFQHVSLDVFVFLVALQQRDGIVVVLAVDLVHLLQLSFEVQEYLSCEQRAQKHKVFIQNGKQERIKGRICLTNMKNDTETHKEVDTHRNLSCLGAFPNNH